MAPPNARHELLKLTDVAKRFTAAGDAVLHGISFSVFDGDCIVISGPNGSGKTVLMTIIAGLEQPTSGSVLRNGNTSDDPLQ